MCQYNGYGCARVCVCDGHGSMDFQYLRSHRRRSIATNWFQSDAAREIEKEVTTSSAQLNTSLPDLFTAANTIPHRMQRIQQHQYESYSWISLVSMKTVCTLNSSETISYAFIEPNQNSSKFHHLNEWSKLVFLWNHWKQKIDFII